MASNNLNPDEIIAVQDIILEYVLSNNWKDYNNFCRLLSENILRKKSLEKRDIENAVSNLSHSFYPLNGISRKEFVMRFPADAIIFRLRNMPKKQMIVKVEIPVSKAVQVTRENNILSIDEVFPELNLVDINTGKFLAESSLDILERFIQNALRDYLREKNATNIVERKSDSSLEVADLEDFTMHIKEKPVSFSAVVKGFKSVRKPSIVFEDIAHQILKANETHPDHLLLIVAKPLADTVVSKLVQYGADCGNRNLVIIMDSVSLARFLRFRKVI